MGQAKQRGTYAERVKQAQAKIPTLHHEGLDYFFKNTSQSDLDNLCGILNEWGREMNGHPLVWKPNAKIKHTITCFYPPVPYTMDMMVAMLSQNQMIGKSLVNLYNQEHNTAIEYAGSEFYVKHDGDLDQLRAYFKRGIGAMKETIQ